MESRNLLVSVFISMAAAASFSQGLTGAPKFSHNPGIYLNSFELSITYSDNGAVIKYTTNGAEPNDNSPIFSGPILITDRTDDPNVFSMIRTTPLQSADPSDPYDILPWKEPYGNVAKGAVIRAAAFKNGNVSQSISGSFFVFPQNSPYRELPLVSIIVDSLSFFGHDEGIYIPGVNYKNDNESGNYYMRSDEWERSGSFEYFDLNVNGNAVISQTVGYRIHGGWTRRAPQKSLRIYARREYGERDLDFKHKLFHYRTAASFKRLILRMGGNDFELAFLRDASAQYMLSHIKSFDTQAFRSAVVFLNGEFWGLHNIRERHDKHYLNRVYGVDSENIDLLDFYGGVTSNTLDPGEGDTIAYSRMAAFARNNNLAEKAALDSILKLMDLDSYLDHYAIQMFLGNQDAIYNNHRLWRERVPFNRNAPVGRDGRFRWLIYDLDQIMDIWRDDGKGEPTFNLIFDPRYATSDLFISLMNNQSVKQSFINRFADLLNSAFLPERTTAVIDSIASTMRPVMDAQVKRWRNPAGWGTDYRATGWENQIERLRNNYAVKPAVFRNTVRDYFSAGNDRSVTLKSDTAYGFIKINSMTVDSKLPRTGSQVYPWSGSYFANVPITVSGVGKPYYRIEKWIVNETEFENPVLTIDLSSEKPYTIEAVFVYDESYIGIAGQKVSRKVPHLSINHRVRSRSNVTFNFTLPKAGNVQLRVYNLAGKEVARVANGKFGSGSYQLNWKTERVASGVYIYRFKTLNRTITGKLRVRK